MEKTGSAAQNKYNAKAHDRITIVAKKGAKGSTDEHSVRMSESTGAFIKRAIAETPERGKGREAFQ